MYSHRRPPTTSLLYTLCTPPRWLRALAAAMQEVQIGAHLARQPVPVPVPIQRARLTRGM